MSDYDEQIQNIVRLKRYETPQEGYFENFLEEFQRRQRSEMLQRSSFSLFIERVSTWFRETGSIKWVAGAGVAYAALMVAILLWPDHNAVPQDRNLAPASYEPASKPAPLAPPKATPAPETTKF